ncbi:alpha/beta hydrolase [Cupriavidus sp. SK-4]|uniref:alpha/beta hydrolase n=1 Tax=Cupriavidus sp. SK-4 TaxID=574750 RepID=UPI0009FCE2FE|nr:alpha/beta hydrolase [Cupriavidus sp. SK-4]
MLEARLRAANSPVVSVPPVGRDDLDCAARVDAIEAAIACVDGPVIVVAHSGGVIMVAHWVRRYRRPIAGALLRRTAGFRTADAGRLSDGRGARRVWLAAGATRASAVPSIVAASHNAFGHYK